VLRIVELLDIEGVVLGVRKRRRGDVFTLNLMNAPLLLYTSQ